MRQNAAVCGNGLKAIWPECDLLYIFLFRIGKGSGFKATELASLKEDETLPIGGKEIQVWKYCLN